MYTTSDYGSLSVVPVVPVGRSAWSLASSKMAVGLGSRQADEEARAEVDVLKSRLEKTSQLTKKIQASLGRLDATGKGVQEAIGPIYGNTQKLQILGQSRSLAQHSRVRRLY
jgi:hypothetical protein